MSANNPEEEMESLVVPSESGRRRVVNQSSSLSPSYHSKFKKCVILLSVGSLFTYIILNQNPGLLLSDQQKQQLGASSLAQSHTSRDELLFTCPNTIQKSENDKNEDLVEWYDTKREEEKEKYASSSESQQEKVSSVYPTNMNETDIQTMMKNHYDGSDWTYEEFKPFMFDFKSKYASLLKSGDSIFESACGIGLNLVMTVNVLKESSNIENLKVHGIEYRASSTADANNILPQLLPKFGGGEDTSLGAPICKGDATDLFFVPSDTFDLAFTGYIEPIQDPTNFQSELGREVQWKDLCESHKVTTERGALDQAAVEEWYAKWVKELIRITKPGQPIGIEQVSKPTCQNRGDWGGVSKKWWKNAVTKYNWDVNVTSIYMVNVYPKDAESRLTDRYNVYMEKNA